MKRIFSAIQPTNQLHIGNYIGAIRQWLHIQNAGSLECYFGIADLHALTTSSNYDVERLAMDTCYQLIACGLDRKKVFLFRQSKIPSILQVYWRLACITNYSWLEGMSHLQQKMQFISERGQSASVGLFSYPILMAADIVALRGTLIPVGLDQKQHVEFVRKIVTVANRLYPNACLELPEGIYSTHPKIMSLQDGKEKMSKSSPNPNSAIYLLDDRKLIESKIAKATTDLYSNIEYNLEKQPEITNLLCIFSSLANISIEELVSRYKDCKSYKQFKLDLTSTICNHLHPIQDKYYKLKNGEEGIEEMLQENELKMERIARETLCLMQNKRAESRMMEME